MAKCAQRLICHVIIASWGFFNGAVGRGAGQRKSATTKFGVPGMIGL